jgi:hypothetical protein
MPVTLTKAVNFGSRAAGLTTIGYTVYDHTGSLESARTEAGVTELLISSSSTGTFFASVEFPDGFSGTIVWDTGDGLGRKLYALEQYNELENDPTPGLTYDTVQVVSSSVEQVKADVSFTKKMTSGRWSVEDNTMIFYDEDNSTVLAKFSLFDEGLKRSEKEVFHRVRNDNDDSTATVLSQVFGKS